MSKNKIEDLRDHLFEVIEALKDPEKPMELDRAKVIADVAQVVINTAKVENDFLKLTGAEGGTGFLPVDREGRRALTEAARPRLAAAGVKKTP